MGFLKWLRLWFRPPPSLWIIIHKDRPLYLECHIDPLVDYIENLRWTTSQVHATTFTDAEKAKVEIFNQLPKDARWLYTITVPRLRDD